ncbi:hypothetical protein U1Q18_008804 [Sarracenia purpurea var. burkii]
MGNCVGRKSSIVWADDDEREIIAAKKPKRGRQRVVGKKGTAFLSSSSSTEASDRREVKIKMTKKELKDLLGRLDLEVCDAPVEKVLSSFIDHATTTDDSFEIQDQQSWRPTLQTIPETESRG